MEQTIDINQHCVSHPAATFYVKASGHRMVEEGINDGDMLVIDRAITARRHRAGLPGWRVHCQEAAGAAGPD
ncbi:S24 family peptidase [Aeromonas hydrophila]